MEIILFEEGGMLIWGGYAYCFWPIFQGVRLFGVLRLLGTPEYVLGVCNNLGSTVYNFMVPCIWLPEKDMINLLNAKNKPLENSKDILGSIDIPHMDVFRYSLNNQACIHLWRSCISMDKHRHPSNQKFWPGLDIQAIAYPVQLSPNHCQLLNTVVPNWESTKSRLSKMETTLPVHSINILQSFMIFEFPAHGTRQVEKSDLFWGNLF